MATRLKVFDISRENFRKFGSVVLKPSGVPTAEAPEFRFWSCLADYHIAGDTEIGSCTVFRPQRNEISGVERHLRTPEFLVPIDGPFILPVLAPDAPDTELRFFRVALGEAVVIHPGVWHGACVPDRAPSSTYFVIFRKGTQVEDVEKKTIAPAAVDVTG